MKKAAILAISVMAVMRAAACGAQEPTAGAKPALPSSSGAQTPTEQVIVSTARLYGDWKMVPPEWPGFDKPVIGDFCSFTKRDQGIAIICADDFMQEVPEVTFNGNKLRLRWGGAFKHTIYDAVWEADGTIDGEIIQASAGIVIRRIKARMERVSDPPAGAAPQDSLAVINNYFADLATGSIREKYYEDDTYRQMKAAAANRAGAFTVNYFGRILEDKGHGPTFPDVFKVSSAGSALQWCLARNDAQGLADVRCTTIP